MHYVSLLVEFLRGRPAVVFWTVALTQAALWTLIPAIFYSAPPGDVPLLLAIGHEFVLGSYLGRRWRFGSARWPSGLPAVRALCSGAGLHRHRLLGGIHLRPAHCRNPARGPRRAADGRHRRIYRAEPEFWPGDPGGATMGAWRCCITGALSARAGAATGSCSRSISGYCCLPSYVGLILLAAHDRVYAFDDPRPARAFIPSRG